ncbi:MAG: hypothetical protein LBS63_05665 [Prevotellaceae bacterium]|jgi:KDO2-lipid IV(A) lauroyltransferase|nr:hypothetical protein [Prevotellaceae bacterium]
MKRFLAAIGSFLLRALLRCVGVLPRGCLCALSNALAFLAGSVVGYRRKVVMGNLRKAFPEKEEKALRSIAAASYRNFFDTVLSILRIRYASRRRVMRSVAYKNLSMMQQLYSKGKDGVLLAGHYSCWEYIGTVQPSIGHQTVAAYQPTAFAPLERVVTEARSRFGAQMAVLKDVFRVLLAHQAKGELTMTLMVSDQSPAEGACSHWVRLLGQPTPVLVGPERIAQKLNSAVMYLRITCPRRLCYEYELVMLSENAALEEPMAITKRFYAALEEDIRRAPQAWMWTHRRWKHQALYTGEVTLE